MEYLKRASIDPDKNGWWSLGLELENMRRIDGLARFIEYKERALCLSEEFA